MSEKKMVAPAKKAPTKTAVKKPAVKLSTAMQAAITKAADELKSIPATKPAPKKKPATKKPARTLVKMSVETTMSPTNAAKAVDVANKAAVKKPVRKPTSQKDTPAFRADLIARTESLAKAAEAVGLQLHVTPLFAEPSGKKVKTEVTLTPLRKTK